MIKTQIGRLCIANYFGQWARSSVSGFLQSPNLDGDKFVIASKVKIGQICKKTKSNFHLSKWKTSFMLIVDSSVEKSGFENENFTYPFALWVKI